MIRVISIASLMALLVLVLYLPSAHSPERFIAQLRIEHRQTSAFWTHPHAERILTRTLDAHTSAEDFSPVPRAASTSASGAVSSAVGNEMNAVNARLFNSQYFRSIDALLLLASYRFFSFLEWLPWLTVFCLAAFVDGGVLRFIKAKQFTHHDPEMFALFVSMTIMLGCGAVIAMVLPLTLPPILLPAVPLVVAAFTAAAVSHFHRRA